MARAGKKIIARGRYGEQQFQITVHRAQLEAWVAEALRAGRRTRRTGPFTLHILFPRVPLTLEVEAPEEGAHAWEYR